MKRATLRRTTAASVPMVEALETRRMLSDGPQITNTVADDRGKITFQFNQALNPATISNSSVQIFTQDNSHNFTVAQTVAVNYRATASTIVAKAAALPPETPYEVVVSDTILGANGLQMDGEFNGGGAASGNGTPGGDYEFQTSQKSSPVAIFTTSQGSMNVQLYNTQVAATVNNFISYADSGAYDNSMFHRSVFFFIIQGGGYEVNTATDQFGTPIPTGSAIADQTGISNTTGTLAMANSGANTATDQWYFNEVNNTGLDSAYTVFGKINSASGLQTMYAIGADPTADLSGGQQNSPFTTVPIRDPATALQRTSFDANSDLVIVQRVALKMVITAAPGAAPGVAHGAATPANLFSTQPVVAPSALATSDLLTAGSGSLLE